MPAVLGLFAVAFAVAGASPLVVLLLLFAAILSAAL